MPGKLTKGKAYFRRLQVKFRRRREGKTDYQARAALIVQDQRSINTPKHRFVVRRTNRDIICQIVLSQITGDICICSAYSHELTRFGIPVGHTNYAACYATGLLLARRLLTKLKLDKIYSGISDITGEYKEVTQAGKEREKGPRPFKAFLDVGLIRTTTGARIFAALKGASDGGLHIPHNEKRFVGYNSKGKKFDPKVLRSHIFGQHVAKYMKDLKAENEEKYKQHFSQYIKAGISPEKLEDLYKKAHAAIRADPSPKVTEKKKPPKDANGKYPAAPYNKSHLKKFPLKLRQKRFQQKLEAIRKKQKKADAVVFSTEGGSDE